ncbi:MAG TPA: hypothetical protein VLH58_13510, partial [Candidatus Methylomirabilis sp.]|nr:hypothetical protein [Candidatus Methylomirabilis sp.]
PADAPTLNDTEGASLVVLYTVPGAPLRQIAVSDGVATLTSNILGTQAPIPIPARLPVARAPFADLRAIDPAGAKLLLLAGDGRPSGTLTRDYAGLDGTLLASDPFTGSDGADWDTKLLDASTALTAGATTATAVVSTLADSVVWVAAILSTPLQSPTLSVTLSGSGTVTSGPAGISCPGDCSQTYAYGTPVTLTATASGGLVFGSWTDCPSPSGNKCTVTMDQAWSVGASFVPPTQTLTVTIGGSSGGSVSSNPSGLTCSPTACTGSFPNGTLVTLTATRDSGGTFREWRGACTGATCQVTMNGPKSVTAVFSKAFTDSTLTTSIPIKVVHFTELREAINTLRARCVQCVPVLGSFAWTDSNLVPRSTPVKTAHLTELRTALAPVYRQKYGKDPIYTTDPSVIAGQTIIKAIHLNALRQFVRDSE